MIPARIAGATHHLAQPPTWDAETDGNCVALWVRAEPEGLCASAWEPTPAELALLNAGGKIVLEIFGGQPPVMLSVTPP